jgi:hypothetical protein
VTGSRPRGGAARGQPERLRIGVISDTHGLLRPEALRALRGSDVVLHAGDIGGAGILEELQAIAPVVAVRGNNDREPWARALPVEVALDLGGVAVAIVHDLNTLTPAAAEGAAVVVSGHSHQPRRDVVGGVLYFNPGSAGPRRFRLPISLGRLDVVGGRVRATLIDLGRRRGRTVT